MSFSASDFPDPPKGSPGGIRAAARSIGQAGSRFEAVGRGLTAASGALQADWQGWAAGTYLASSRGLAAAVQNGAKAFETCEEAISAYAGILEDAQDEIERLRGLWEEAKAREATASSQLVGLAGDLAGAKPSEVAGIEGRMGAAAATASDAGDDADGYVRRAYEVLDQFKADQQAQQDILSGKNPFEITSPFGAAASPFGGGTGGGLMGPGFGVPPGGLSSLNGVIGVEHPDQEVVKGISEWVFGGFGDQYKSEEDLSEALNVPGDFWRFADATGQAPNSTAEPVGDLTNVVLLFGGGVAVTGVRALGTAARAIATGTAERLGIGTAGRVAVQRSGQEAFAKELAAGDRMSTSLRDRMASGFRARRDAEIATSIAQQEARGRAVQHTLDVAKKLGVKLPEGTPEILGNVTRFSDQYRYYTLAKLLQAREVLQAKGPAGEAAARMLTRLLEGAPR